LHTHYFAKATFPGFSADDAGNIQSAFPDGSVNYVEATELEMPYWMMTYAEEK
jgi:hypothetical protein